ncbi:glutamine amidotransferase [Candidatus Peregrinibacteria bacterium]|jgi:GMP synthase (glutamine-hydrolysing)|nr:glutamine amidotransferase [Candidatus Peregrinibacteria bacterium]MBT4632242.1 glutamine amidotransferase [Candidatus Peregrinibacteria bacterium]MBT5824347.1 glutamine amidotransferase [Candidatus Peregrinibacteria bacterium]
MKPFLILQLRTVDEAADHEFQSILKYSGLTKNEVVRIRMEQNGIPELNLQDYSGVIVGGGPLMVSDPTDKKTPAEQKFEPQLNDLQKEIIEKDFPYFGACTGLCTLTKAMGGEVATGRYSESVEAIEITLNEDGQNDPLLKNLPKSFIAFSGHKESCQNLPKGATLLASSEKCPIHIIRVKNNVYASQFHPELDVEGIENRVNIYKHKGYFPAEDAKKIIDDAKKFDIPNPRKILKNFAEKYRS